MGYSTLLLFEGPPVWMHLYGWSRNVRYPAVGEAFEVEFGANPNALLLDCRRSLEAGYVPYPCSGTPVELDHAYSERASPPSTISDPYFSARIRHSDDFFGQQGQNWNKRVRTGVPLDFGPLSRNPSMEIYGTYGNFRVDNFIRDGLPVNKCNYWQLGLTTLALDPEFHVAYVGTNISYESCACTNYCSGRLCFSMTKSF